MSAPIRGGTVHARKWTGPDGRKRKAWGFTVQVPEGGGLKRVRRQGYASKEEAEDGLDAFKREWEAPSVAKKSMTLGAAVARYTDLKGRKRSFREDRRHLAALVAEFGEGTALDTLTADRITDYKAKLLRVDSRKVKGAKLSPATVNRRLSCLRHLLHLAEDWGVVAAVPRIRLEKEPQGRLRWLTPEDANRLLAKCRESRNAILADIVEFCLFTGLRQSEALGLTWERADRSRGVVLLEVTKSGKRREVPLNSEADAVLVRRGPKDAGSVFGRPRWSGYRTAWDTAVDRAALGDFHFHDLRHTFASWAIQQGVSLPELRDLLGHSSLSMVLRYAHLAPEHLRRAVNRVSGILDAASAPGSEDVLRGAYVAHEVESDGSYAVSR